MRNPAVPEYVENCPSPLRLHGKDAPWDYQKKSTNSHRHPDAAHGRSRRFAIKISMS
jgi:hypothetical protein